MRCFRKEITSSYGADPEKSRDYARIISSNNVRRLEALMHSGTIVTGGKCDPERCYVEPTVIKDIRPDDPVMDEEIFGPLLPVIDYDDFKEVYGIIEQHPKPLAVYIFTEDRNVGKRIH